MSDTTDNRFYREKQELPTSKERVLPKTELEWIAYALNDAAVALPVLFTMLAKIGAREGAMVADEILGHVKCAQKQCSHLVEAERRASHEPPAEQRCPHCQKVLTLRQDEKGPNAADLANNGAHVDLCSGSPPGVGPVESFAVGEVRRDWPHDQRMVRLEDYEARRDVPASLATVIKQLEQFHLFTHSSELQSIADSLRVHDPMCSYGIALQRLADEVPCCCSASEVRRVEFEGDIELCSDCPPRSYPTEATRCDDCPRRIADLTVDDVNRYARLLRIVPEGEHVSAQMIPIIAGQLRAARATLTKREV